MKLTTHRGQLNLRRLRAAGNDPDSQDSWFAALLEDAEEREADFEEAVREDGCEPSPESYADRVVSQLLCLTDHDDTAADVIEAHLPRYGYVRVNPKTQDEVKQ